eukprot:c12899_g1_i1.p1 GENE.c12899_g1_i1~~c12899_g1_i1.p1  ORF type:complete len:277 (-),score=54.22 c12899_g1_i1:76-906(-)
MGRYGYAERMLRVSSGVSRLSLAQKTNLWVGVAWFATAKKKVGSSQKLEDPMDGSQPNRDFDHALRLVRAHARARFDETVEVKFHLNVDPRKANQVVRVMTKLPHGTGQKIRVAVFADGQNAVIAREAGAHVVGSNDLADQIKAGVIDFDRCIATPDMMGIVGKVARILGPRQLMPNPKHGTVTTDVRSAVLDAKAGQVNFKVDRNSVLHCHFGKLSFDDKSLKENFSALIDGVIAARPDVVKGLYIKSAAFCSTMGPGIKAELAKLHPSLSKQGN